jgi:uncharacterized protein YuzE
MKIRYDIETDSITVEFRENAAAEESAEIKDGVIVDFDRDGEPVALEILNAAKRGVEADKVDFQTVGTAK